MVYEINNKENDVKSLKYHKNKNTKIKCKDITNKTGNSHMTNINIIARLILITL